MAYTKTWNAAFEAVPDTNLDDVADGAEVIRDFKTAVRERLDKDHYLDISGTDADHGEHRKVTFHEVISTPAAEAGKGKLYTKTVSGIGELHFQDTTGTEMQLTGSGAIYSEISYIVDADKDTKIQTEESADEDVIRFDIAGDEQFNITNGFILPTVDNDLDLGSSSKQFKDTYVLGSFIQNSVARKISKSSPSTVTTVTLSSLSAGKMYKLSFYLTFSDTLSLYIRFNSDSGANYTYSEHFDGKASGVSYHEVAQGTGVTSGYLVPSNGVYCIGAFIFYGTGNNTIFHGSSFVYGSSSSFINALMSGWYAGAAGLSSVTLVSSNANTFTGEIWLEEMD